MLPRLTPKQRQRANALIKRLCANYDNGNCLALDDGEPCACVQSISYSLLCKYFRKAVLPAEPLLDEFDYPPVTIDDVYKEVLEQAENFKKYAD